ncbi:hypothetical protein JP0157_07320 [Helicobacter pylori]
MMVLENAGKFKEHLGSLFDEMGFYGSFEVVEGNNINLNIIPKDNNDLPTKEQVLEKLQEKVIKTKKQELESQINAICKEKIIKSIPEVLEKGTKGTDHLGRVFVDYGNKRVGLNNEWKNEKLENHWVISSYELYDTEKQALRSTPQAITKEKAFNSLNSVEPNPNIKSE